jgi:hypothetical protein
METSREGLPQLYDLRELVMFALLLAALYPG